MADPADQRPNESRLSASRAAESGGRWRLAIRWVLVAVWAMWQGGFTFYAGFVVPIGAEVLGSELEQGLVTQQVTPWLNRIALLLAVLWAALGGRIGRAPWGRRRRCLIWLVWLALTLFLIVWHQWVGAEIDLERRWLEDADRFYVRHQIYLWAATLQWLLGWSILAVLVGDSDRPQESERETRTSA